MSDIEDIETLDVDFRFGLLPRSELQIAIAREFHIAFRQL